MYALRLFCTPKKSSRASRAFSSLRPLNVPSITSARNSRRSENGVSTSRSSSSEATVFSRSVRPGLPDTNTSSSSFAPLLLHFR